MNSYGPDWLQIFTQSKSLHFPINFDEILDFSWRELSVSITTKAKIGKIAEVMEIVVRRP